MPESTELMIPQNFKGALVPKTHVNFDYLLSTEPGSPTILTNVRTDREDEENIAFVAGGPGSFPIADMIGKTFELAYFWSHRIELSQREGGEIVNVVRTVLINPQQETVACVSRGITDSLGTLMALRGYGPWNPPVVILFREVATNNKRRVYNFVLAPKVQPETKSRKG